MSCCRNLACPVLYTLFEVTDCPAVENVTRWYTRWNLEELKNTWKCTSRLYRLKITLETTASYALGIMIYSNAPLPGFRKNAWPKLIPPFSVCLVTFYMKGNNILMADNCRNVRYITFQWMYRIHKDIWKVCLRKYILTDSTTDVYYEVLLCVHYVCSLCLKGC